MICPKCKYELEHDEESHMYYCEECNHLYSEDEILRPNVELYKLTPLMSIPFVNFAILSRIKSEDERRVYTNITISSMIMLLIYCVIFVVVLYSVKDMTITKFRIEARQFMESTVKVSDPRQLQPEVYEFKGPVIGDKPEEQEEYFKLTDEVIQLLDDSAVSGETLKHIVNQYTGYTYLIQTLSCSQKYQNTNYYFCVGYDVRETSDNGGATGTRFYSGDLEGPFTPYDNFIDSDVLEKEMTIMYIYESQRFNVTTIYNRQGSVIGLAFVELEGLS